MHQFPQDHVTLNNIVMMLKIQLWSQKYILTDIDIVIIFNFLLYFWSNKCYFGEQRRLLWKTLANLYSLEVYDVKMKEQIISIMTNAIYQKQRKSAEPMIISCLWSTNNTDTEWVQTCVFGSLNNGTNTIKLTTASLSKSLCMIHSNPLLTWMLCPKGKLLQMCKISCRNNFT